MKWLTIGLILFATWPTNAHEIYTGLRGKNGQLCCGADDCEPTVYELRKGHYFFFTREHHWIEIPEERITFLPIPGDEDVTTHNHAHLCYREAVDSDFNNPYGTPNLFTGEGETIWLWCAFIPPGAI